VPPITQMVAPIADASLDARSIRVNPDETLYKISVENYGKYNRTIVARIQELNPRLKNPNLIQSGEKLRIPKDLESSTIAQSALDRASSDQSDKVEKP
jgi:LysM repeat protein